MASPVGSGGTTTGVASLLQSVWQHPLNADHRVSAIGRLAWWQIVSRLRRDPIALPFVERTRLFATRGMTGATGNWYCGLHEHIDMAFVLHVLRRADHFLDIGANVGSYTILAAVTGAEVTSIEPISRTFRHLQRNVTMNGFDGVITTWQGGVSDTTGTKTFTSGLDTANHVRAASDTGDSVDVPVTTIDSLLHGRIPTVIKIDVEGYEHHVLQGGRRTLADPRLLAVVVERSGGTSLYGTTDDDVLALMKGSGFLPFTYDPFTRRLVNPEPGATRSNNTIFVRDRATVEHRVTHSRRYRLVNGSI